LLESIIKQADRFTAPPVENGWRTFGGSPTRNGVPSMAPGGLPPVQGPQWTVRLDTGQRVPPMEEPLGGPADSRNASDEGRRCVFYPLIVDDRVLVADGRFVTAYDLVTGGKAFEYDLFSDGETEDASLSPGPLAEPDLACTLTADDDRVYARLGAPA